MRRGQIVDIAVCMKSCSGGSASCTAPEPVRPKACLWAAAWKATDAGSLDNVESPRYVIETRSPPRDSPSEIAPPRTDIAELEKSLRYGHIIIRYLSEGNSTLVFL